jgi:hypothetical protein
MPREALKDCSSSKFCVEKAAMAGVIQAMPARNRLKRKERRKKIRGQPVICLGPGARAARPDRNPAEECMETLRS